MEIDQRESINPDVQDTETPRSTLLPLVGIAAALVGAVVIFVWYYTLPDPTNHMSEETIQLNQNMRTAYDTFWKERNFEEGMAMAEEVLIAAEKIGGDREAAAKANRAALLARDEGDKAIAEWAAIYHDESYPPQRRALAAFSAFWYSAARLNDQALTPEWIKQNVFVPGRFDVLPANTPLETETDLLRAFALAFDSISKMWDNEHAALAAARYYMFYLPADLKRWESGMEYLDIIQDRYSQAMKWLPTTIQRSYDQNVYYSPNSYSLMTRFAAYLMPMAIAGYADVDDVYSAAEESLAYNEKFKDASLLAGNYQAETGWRYACALAYFEKRPLTQQQQEKIRGLLNHLYNLHEDEVERRGQLRRTGSNPGGILFACYEPLVYIAKNVDPRLKDFLINRLGGWDEADFK